MPVDRLIFYVLILRQTVGSSASYYVIAVDFCFKRNHDKREVTIYYYHRKTSVSTFERFKNLVDAEVRGFCVIQAW